MPFRSFSHLTKEVRCCGKVRDTRFCGSCGSDLRLKNYVAYGYPKAQPRGGQEVTVMDDGEGIEFCQSQINTFQSGVTCNYLSYPVVGTPLLAEVRLPYGHYGFAVDFRTSWDEEYVCDPAAFHLTIEVRTDETGKVEDVVIKKTLPVDVQIREEADDYNDPPANGGD